MANSNLRKIILEELHKVLNEQGVDTPYGSSEKVSMGPAPSAKVAPKKVGDPKVKKLQNLLASVGLNVGKIDGIPGPLLYKAISQVAQVPEQRVAKDFASSGPNAADNHVTVIGSDPQKLSATGNLPIDSEITPSGLPTVKSSLGAGVEKIPGTEKKSFERDPEATKINTKKEEAPVDTSKIGVRENLRKELVRMLKNL